MIQVHDDNYGLLYDSRTFEFKSLSSCYDHNVAFQESFLGLARTTIGNSASLPLDELGERFIKNHTDIEDRLKTIELSEIKEYLSERQLAELVECIENAIKWAV